MKNIYYLAGVTCAGKDYFIEYCLEKYPHMYDAIQVGKEMRRRHPPEFFKGSGAPAHCEAEALEIFQEGVEKAMLNSKPYLLVAGQPRRLSQIPKTIGAYPGEVLWLGCDLETQLERMSVRFKGDPAGYELAVARAKQDRIDLYDILWELTAREMHVEACDSQSLIDYVTATDGHLAARLIPESHFLPFPSMN